MRLAWTWIIIDKNKRILLTKRSNYTKAFPGYWCIPWWRWEIWETAEEIVIREIKEEVWLDFKPTKVFHACKVNNNWEDILSNRFIWNYSWKINIQEEEIDWYAWYKYEEIKDLKIAFNHIKTLDKLHNEDLI